MEARPDPTGDRLLIAGYDEKGFRLRGEIVAGRHDGPLLLHARSVLTWDGTLTAEALTALVSVQPPIELVLFGTGTRLQPLPATLRRDLRARGMAVEPMATPAACRTYNLLQGDDRRVAAARLPAGHQPPPA